MTANTHPRRCIGRAESPGRRKRPRPGRRGRRNTGWHLVNVHNCSPPARPRRPRIPATCPGNGPAPDLGPPRHPGRGAPVFRPALQSGPASVRDRENTHVIRHAPSSRTRNEN